MRKHSVLRDQGAISTCFLVVSAVWVPKIILKHKKTQCSERFSQMGCDGALYGLAPKKNIHHILVNPRDTLAETLSNGSPGPGQAARASLVFQHSPISISQAKVNVLGGWQNIHISPFPKKESPRL